MNDPLSLNVLFSRAPIPLSLFTSRSQRKVGGFASARDDPLEVVAAKGNVSFCRGMALLLSSDARRS